MPVFRIEIGTKPIVSHAEDPLAARLREAGLPGIERVSESRLFFLEGRLDLPTARRVAEWLLVDPVTETASVLGERDALPDAPRGAAAFEVHLRPGVMDPVAESTLAELAAEGYAVESVRTARRFIIHGKLDAQDVPARLARVLANDCIEQLVPGAAPVRPGPKPPVFEFALRRVPIRDLDDAGLEQLARQGHLFLALDEMQAIRRHFRDAGREPTDLELETIAQTWSEHCVHKTLKSAVVYRGAPFPGDAGRSAKSADVELRFDNLLKDTIVRATETLMAANRGPRCLSVFRDNAGIIAFDDDFAVAFKVETHNHPSAIEPYGGAATGVGGCIRDVIGCGLGAKPIANTDVFCVAPGDWPYERLPKGVLHPRRVLRGIVQGVADYGNRMGIPTVNGAIYFDPRYVGNPLVFCGCVGLIPRDRTHKEVQSGDLIVLVGGRTGRDGIHGATFSSAELTDTHADEFSHAVQIGNAITEKRFLDAILQARDAAGGCLYTAITDCGAGGLSSAVGEMGEHTGATVELERVPLKYAGLRYDETWISEAQERMVLAVPRRNLERFQQIMQAEEVESTVIGVFSSESTDPAGGTRSAPAARLVVRYQGHVVGDLAMELLHNGLPRRERVAAWRPAPHSAAAQMATGDAARPADRLLALLVTPNIASKEWVIRKYDHEVQGGSVVKPLQGPGRGPGDAAVLRPRLGSQRGIAIGCGLAPQLGDADPYWMALAAIDEAVRNVVCVGADPGRIAVLDNFCWGRTDDPQQFGGLVRACQACHDAALAYGTPFISGKDSLNNEFALDETDVDAVLAAMKSYTLGADDAAAGLRAAWEPVAERIRRTRRVSIPGTLLISAVGLVDDVRRCVTSGLRTPGAEVCLVGGLDPLDFALATAARVHAAVGAAQQAGLVAACHDAGDGGWLTALAEMAIAGNRGADVPAAALAEHEPFGARVAGYVVEAHDAAALAALCAQRQVACVPVGRARADRTVRIGADELAVEALRAAWSGSAA